MLIKIKFNIIILMLRKLQAIIARKLQNTKSTQPILKLFLTGVKGQLGRVHYPKPYNFYISVGSIILTLFVGKCVIKYRQHEIKKKGNNWLIPDIIYDVRQESHIYWEVVRRAKGIPTTFTFYKWDGDSLMYQIDRKGQQTPLHTHRAIEDTRTFLSPFHEYLFPASAQVHSNILLYVKNINNPYCLFNYLRLKPVNIGDWIRAGYFSIYRGLGLTNRWRYDQFVRKPDIYYRWQKVKLAYFLSKDRQKLYQTIQKANIKLEDIVTFLFWFL